MKELKSNINTYPIGITGKFESDMDYFTVLGKIQVKLIQIIKYCRMHRREVVLYLDESTPFAFYSFFYAQGLKVIPVLKEIQERNEFNIVHTADINKFLDENTYYIMVICDKESVQDFEFEKDVRFYVPEVYDTRKVTLIEDPRTSLKDAVQKVNQDNDPYSIFFHELLYQLQPLNYYDEIMQTKPDANALTDREFANVKNTKAKNNRKI